LIEFFEDFLGNRIIDATVAFSNLVVDGAISFLEPIEVLLSDVSVSIGTGGTTFALAADEERADVGCVAFGSLRAPEPLEKVPIVDLCYLGQRFFKLRLVIW